MDNKPNIGDTVLIFESYYNDDYDKGINWYYPIKPFKRGTIIDKQKSDDLSQHGSPWYVTIYKVLGEDGNIYMGTYKHSIIGSSFFYTEEDYIDRLIYYIKLNNERVDEINKITKEIEDNINLIKGIKKTKGKRLKYEKR